MFVATRALPLDRLPDRALDDFNMYLDTQRLRIAVSNMKNANDREELEQIKVRGGQGTGVAGWWYWWYYREEVVDIKGGRHLMVMVLGVRKAFGNRTFGTHMGSWSPQLPPARYATHPNCATPTAFVPLQIAVLQHLSQLPPAPSAAMAYVPPRVGRASAAEGLPEEDPDVRGGGAAHDAARRCAGAGA